MNDLDGVLDRLIDEDVTVDPKREKLPFRKAWLDRYLSSDRPHVFGSRCRGSRVQH
jgi:hypothetical protein